VFREPPFEVVETLCPGCEAIGYHNEDPNAAQEDVPSRYGIHLAFKPVRESD
jgi:hypothetical protein